MNSSKTLQLIEGKFLHEEAKEILSNIFNSKINFHQLKNFSSQERLGKDDAIAQKRIPALENEILRLEEILAEAKANNKALMITSEITISLSND